MTASRPGSPSQPRSGTNLQDSSKPVTLQEIQQLLAEKMPTTIISMPFLGSQQAFRFKGKKLESFLTNFEWMAKRAGIKEQELPFEVLNYCSTSVQELLERNPAFKGNDWDAAKREMRLYYADKGNDRVTVVGLRGFSEKMRREKKVRTRRAVDKYAIAFGKKMGDLVPRALMSESERDVLFFRGLDEKVRKGIIGTLEQVKGERLTIVDPATMAQVIEAAREYFSTENLDYDPDSEEEESGSSDDDEGESSSEDSSSSGSSGSRRKGKKKKVRVSTQDLTAVVLESVAHLSEQIRWLSLSIGQGRGASHVVNTGLTNAPPSFSKGGRFCWGCGKKEGVDLDHALDIKRCPLTLGLLRDGLVKFAPDSGQLVRADGSPLPLANEIPGGFAAIIRREHWDCQSNHKVQDALPHTTGKPASVVAMGFMRNEEEVLRGDGFAASSEEVYSFQMQTRAQTKAVGKVLPDDESQKSIGFEFEHAGERTKLRTPKPAVREPASSTLLTPAKEVETPRIKFQPRKSNAELGWRERERLKREDSSNALDAWTNLR